MARARLRNTPREKFGETFGPAPFFESVRIKPGAIVYRLPPDDVVPEKAMNVLMHARSELYKVLELYNNNEYGRPIKFVKLVPFSKKPLPPPKTKEESPGQAIAVPLSSVSLIELNRGKTGALNFFMDMLRAKTRQWINRVEKEDVNTPPNSPEPAVQLFVGIVDARHTLVEPNIFWNDALPYFSIVKQTQEPGKDTLHHYLR